MPVMNEGTVITVTGPQPAENLGPTSMHEHLCCDFRNVYGAKGSDGTVRPENSSTLKWNPFAIRDNLVLDNTEVIVRELEAFRASGGGSIVEVTPIDTGRDLKQLRALSSATGVPVIAGTGYYIHAAHAGRLESLTVSEIHAELVESIVHGDQDATRAGIIGELGTSERLFDCEQRVLQAAAHAQIDTGVALTVHLDARSRIGPHVVDVLEDAGADLRKVVLGHCDEHITDSGVVDVAYIETLLARGVNIGFDTFGTEVVYAELHQAEPTDLQRLRGLAHLVRLGHADRIVLGQDIFLKHLLAANGGPGYAYLFRTIRQVAAGLVDIPVTAWDTMLCDNPRRLLPAAIT